METPSQKILAKFEAHLRHVDESALVILKGHLVIEEALSKIISTFVFHGEYLDGARISFAQKVAIARSMSLYVHNSETWQIILAINTLRNELAHALDSPKRVAKTKALIDIHKRLNRSPSASDGNEVPEHAILSFTVSYSLGFLSSFIEEVQRFKFMHEDMERKHPFTHA